MSVCRFSSGEDFWVIAASAIPEVFELTIASLFLNLFDLGERLLFDVQAFKDGLDDPVGFTLSDLSDLLYSPR
jgi:hypothetical protein